MFRDYLAWWTAQMRQWLPARFVNRDRGAVDAVIIELFSDDVGRAAEIVLRRRRQERQLGRFGLDTDGLRALRAAVPSRGRPRDIILRLPPKLLLEREVVLPLAAEREPERVLTYEMDRITPFGSSEVYWTYATEQRDRANGRLHLRLSLVTKQAVETVLAALAHVDLGATSLEVRNGAGVPRRISLQWPDSRLERLTRRSLRVAWSACGVLAVATVALPLMLQSVAQHRIEARMAALRPLVAEAEALRHRIATNTAAVDVVEAERIRSGDVLDVLAALTRLLPDDTFLTDFTMRQGKLTLSGQSAAAVRLIAALSGDPVIRNPEFVAPVTRFDNRADLFTIRAEIAR